MRQEEYELLKRYLKNYKKLFYNLKPGRPGTKKVNRQLIKEIKTEANWLRTGDYKGKKFKHLSEDCLRKPKVVSEIDKWTKVQTRDESINRKNINKIKDRIDMESGKPSDKAKAVVVLVDREYSPTNKNRKFHRVLIISGNHTIQAYMEFENYKDFSTLPYVVIPPEVHEKLSDVEVETLSNDFNEEVELQAPFTKETAVKEVLGNIDRKQSWGHKEMTQSFVDRGLSRPQVRWVYKEVELEIKNKKHQKGGGVIPDYRETGRDRWMLNQEATKYQDGETFIYYSSISSIKPNKLWRAFIEANEERLLNGEKPYNKIRVIAYARKPRYLKTWLGTPESPRGLKWEFEQTLDDKKELSQPIQYTIMDRKVSGVVHSELKEKWEKSQTEQFDKLFNSVPK